MYHQDGRCASNAETVVVTATSSNLPITSVPAGIRLVVIRGAVSGTLTWSLPTTPQMTIVGQSAGTVVATLTGNGTGSTLHVKGGDLYVRGLTVTGGAPGIIADTGAILRLDHVSVSNNASGGILLDGAAFDIKNTTVNSNPAANGDPGIRIQNAATGSPTPKTLSLTTVSGNTQAGVSCASNTVLTASGVSASGNGGIDITLSCGFSSCGTASATCGAQP
jgi:hypothetical protein